MEKREWKDPVAISYLYVAFAGITDNNFHENEQSWIDIIAGIIGVEFNV